MKVKVKDWNKKIHKTKVALNMGGINIDYPTTELLLMILKRIKNKEFTLDEATEMQYNHQKKWDDYFEKLDKEKK